MSNYAFLYVGTEAEFAKPPSEQSGRTVASCAYGVPLLWLTMFAPEEMKAAYKAGEVDEAFIGCTAPVSTALTRLRSQHRRLSTLFDAAPGFEQHAAMLGEAFAGRAEPLVQADLTEVGTMIDAERFVTELELFLRWIATGEWPQDYRPKPRNLLARIFARPPGPSEFVRVNCNLERKTPIPEAARIRKFAELAGPEQRIVSFVLGASWDDPLPWEK